MCRFHSPNVSQSVSQTKVNFVPSFFKFLMENRWKFPMLSVNIPLKCLVSSTTCDVQCAFLLKYVLLRISFSILFSSSSSFLNWCYYYNIPFKKMYNLLVNVFLFCFSFYFCFLIYLYLNGASVTVPKMINKITIKIVVPIVLHWHRIYYVNKNIMIHFSYVAIIRLQVFRPLLLFFFVIRSWFVLNLIWNSYSKFYICKHFAPP